jgi:hypothetical protein
MKKATASKTKTTPAKPARSPEKVKSPAKSKAAKSSQAASPEPVAAPAVKTTPPAPTTITAVIDIGFGNSLWLRGDGPGLSWEKGVRMECVADDQWTITLGEVTSPVLFKVLVNDLSWSAGDDYVVQPGEKLVIKPTF